MRKTILWTLVAVTFLLIIVWLALRYREAPEIITSTAVESYKDATYSIDGVAVALNNGVAEMEIVPGSASKIKIQYFGNEVVGDLNADGLKDIAFLITKDAGGSGIFYYVVVAINTPKGYVGSQAFFLGDRIAPQTTEIQDGDLVINYADRMKEEPMSTKPSLGVSKYLHLFGYTLQEQQ